MTYYLRFEAVNLNNFIYDTNDLNTIRGGGLLLLEAVKVVEEIIKNKLPNLINITQGASWALFELSTDEHQQVIDIKQDIINRLNSDDIFCHATFVVDILKSSNKYKIDRDSLHALNRWQQMQSPSLSIPQLAETVCQYDKVRPASLKSKMSLSVAKRRNYGTEQKRGEFYKNRTSFNLDDLKFTHDLNELSDDTTRGILNGKLAIIYVDGNKLSSLSQACKNAKEQSKFDTKLRNGQNLILKALLEKAVVNKNNAWKNKGKIRLETLLWGGDELIWVVPAWLGWQTLQLFFENAKNIKINPDILNRADYKTPNNELSFAAGLVFCHHNAPIHRITTLAKNLVDLAKQNYPYQNALAYQILESFDHAGVAIENYRKNRLANLADTKDLFITADKMAHLVDVVQQLKNQQFPRRKSYQIIKALLANDDVLADSLIEKIVEDSPNISILLDQLKSLCGTKNAHWLHLTDLWDFIALQESSEHD